MSKIIKHLLMVCVCLVLSTKVLAYQFMTGEMFKKHTYDPLPLENGEKVLLTEKGDLIENVIFLVITPYAKVKESFRTIAQERFRKIAYVERIASVYPNLRNKFDEEKKEIEKDISKLRSLNINIENFKETVITSGRYNVNEKEKKYSELDIRIIDGKDVFDRNCTLILLQRVDHWRGWIREFHTKIPLPIKGSGETHLITSTELKLIEELKKISGILVGKYYYSFLFHEPLGDIKTLTDIEKDLKEIR